MYVRVLRAHIFINFGRLVNGILYRGGSRIGPRGPGINLFGNGVLIDWSQVTYMCKRYRLVGGPVTY